MIISSKFLLTAIRYFCFKRNWFVGNFILYIVSYCYNGCNINLTVLFLKIFFFQNFSRKLKFQNMKQFELRNVKYMLIFPPHIFNLVFYNKISNFYGAFDNWFRDFTSTYWYRYFDDFNKRNMWNRMILTIGQNFRSARIPSCLSSSF